MTGSFVVSALILAFLFQVALAETGTATFYTPPYVPSSCYEFEDKGVMIAAASDALWGNRAACGRRYRVTCTGATNQVAWACTGGSVDVTVVDYCPQGCAGTIDLSQEAFAVIANPDAGKVKITYTEI
ncbi:EG45-like domain containing protein [Wolffia australiana]